MPLKVATFLHHDLGVMSRRGGIVTIRGRRSWRRDAEDRSRAVAVLVAIYSTLRPVVTLGSLVAGWDLNPRDLRVVG